MTGIQGKLRDAGADVMPITRGVWLARGIMPSCALSASTERGFS